MPVGFGAAYGYSYGLDAYPPVPATTQVVITTTIPVVDLDLEVERMSVSITLEQTNTTTTDEDHQPSYSSENAIVASDGIPLALFVYDVASEAYSHVAAVADIETYPDSLAQAVSDELPFYRQVAATQEYTTITEAQAFATHVQTRLNFLAQDYPKTQDAFVGTETYTFTTSED